METIRHRMNKSRRAFARQGAALANRSRKATTIFVAETREAGRTFVRFCLREGESWRHHLEEARRQAFQQAVDSLTPPSLQRGALVQLERALQALHEAVKIRIHRLDRQEPQLPFDDFQAMTAKAIVAELDQLDPAQCRALYDLESRNKRRSTVIRAIEHRLAA